MKKLFNLALVGTMVLAAAACQREQVGSSSLEANENGVVEVPTQFVLNVASTPQTKMSADVVQQNQNFRGIQDARLFTYKTGMFDQGETPYVLNTGTPAEGTVKTYDLGLLMAAHSLDNTGDKNKTESSERILQLSVPVGVDAVLFYGKAIKGTGDSDMIYGCTYDYDYTDSNKPSTVLTTPASTEFYAHPILDATNKTAYEQTGSLMIAAINKILNTEVLDSPSETFGEEGAEVTFTNLPAVSWAMYGHRYEYDKIQNPRYAPVAGIEMLDHAIRDLEEVVGQCYYLFTYIRPSDIPGNLVPGSAEWLAYITNPEHKLGTFAPLGEYRGGSSFSLLRQVGDMYKVLGAVATSIPTNLEEANAVRLARRIISNALFVFDVENQGFRSKDDIVSFVGDSGDYSRVTTNMIKNYPGCFNIPEGAAQLGFHYQGETISGGGGTKYAEDVFYYHHPQNYPLVNPTMTAFEPRKYIYPAELWYFTNSPIRISEKDITWTAMNGSSNWSDDNKWSSDWESPAKVTSATRAIAVKNNINYGVALLKSIVQTTVPVLKDNRAKWTDETTDREITVATSQIKLNGILVGGQNPRMNWQFVRKHDSGEFSYFDGVVYDNATGTPEISSPITNYTLLYDNFNSSQPESSQNDVYVSLEFINGGAPFWGRDNLIPTGGKFYLVGKLGKPGANAIDANKWPTDHQIAPVYGLAYGTNYTAEVPSGKKAGESRKVARVFIQDFMTTATFKIGVDALKHAYYSVPDLRASQMSLGLSVDLQWSTGLDYSVDL